MSLIRNVFKIFFLMVSLGACTQEKSSQLEKPNQAELESRARAKIAVDQAIARRVPTTTVSMNCRDHGWNYENSISSYAVEEVWYGQITKKLVGAGGLGCGGILHVGYQLPTTWQPHMKVLVRWTPKWAGSEYTIERYTTIPYYAEPGTVTVHFFSKDRVRIVIANNGPESTLHPILADATEPPPEVDGDFEQPPNPPNPPPPAQACGLKVDVESDSRISE